MIIEEDKEYYVFLDEIQHVKDIKNPWLDGQNEKIGFVDVLLGLMKIKNADIYVTGSNSKMLSSDIVTQFRDRGDEIRLYPLSFREFYNAFPTNKENAWKEYLHTAVYQESCLLVPTKKKVITYRIFSRIHT
jgi:predicted AAA+ superfamily ATPase